MTLGIECLLTDDPGRAAELAERVKRAHPKCIASTSAPTTDDKDILINATPIGMAGTASPIDIARLHRDLFVVDIVPQPVRSGGSASVHHDDA